MSKAVMISIRPKWCAKIIIGRKTMELRKSVPKLEVPFKCYIYCTSGHPYISVKGGNLDRDTVRTNTAGRCNGKVIGEFVCDRVDALARVGYMGSGEMPRYNILNADARIRPAKELFQRACLTEDEAEDYLKGRYGFGWHISDLKLYEAPKELSEFRRVCPNDLYCESCAMHRENNSACGNESLRLKRPPQSWCYVEEM